MTCGVGCLPGVMTCRVGCLGCCDLWCWLLSTCGIGYLGDIQLLRNAVIIIIIFILYSAKSIQFKALHN